MGTRFGYFASSLLIGACGLVGLAIWFDFPFLTARGLELTSVNGMPFFETQAFVLINLGNPNF